jgi:hypothetical protein
MWGVWGAPILFPTVGRAMRARVSGAHVTDVEPDATDDDARDPVARF